MSASSHTPRESYEEDCFSNEDAPILPTTWVSDEVSKPIQVARTEIYGFDRLRQGKNWRLRFFTRLEDLYQDNKGLLLIGASQFFMACMACIVKLMSARDNPATAAAIKMSTLELIVVRMSITWICSISWMLYKGIPHPFLGPPGIRGWLLIRGISGFFGLFGIYFSVQYLSLSDATAITFLSPSVTALLGYVLLGEAFSLREACAGVLSLAGVVLIARPSFLFKTHPQLSLGAVSTVHQVRQFADVVNTTTENYDLHTSPELPRGDNPENMRMVAIGVALLGVLGAAVAYTSLRRISKNAHTMNSICYFCGCCVFISVIGMVVKQIPWVMPPDWKWSIGLVAIGLLGFSAQILLTKGLQIESAGRGSLALYVLIIFALALERFVFGTEPPPLSFVGILLILSSAIFVVIWKPSKESRPKGERDMPASHLYIPLNARQDNDSSSQGNP